LVFASFSPQNIIVLKINLKSRKIMFSRIALLTMMVAKTTCQKEVVMDITVAFNHHTATMDAAQKCLIETFGLSHRYISAHNVFSLEDAWVMPPVDGKNGGGGSQRFLRDATSGPRTMQFQAIVAANDPEYPVPAPAPRLAQPHGGSCGPTCPPDDDMLEEKEELVPAPAPTLAQPHGGSCGPTCPPDDDYLIEEKAEIVPSPAPKLTQPHGGSCGPTCPPDDDAFKTKNGDIVVSTPDDDPVESENDDIVVNDDIEGKEQSSLSPTVEAAGPRALLMTMMPLRKSLQLIANFAHRVVWMLVPLLASRPIVSGLNCSAVA
jgi:hypothetical protein